MKSEGEFVPDSFNIAYPSDPEFLALKFENANSILHVPFPRSGLGALLRMLQQEAVKASGSVVPLHPTTVRQGAEMQVSNFHMERTASGVTMNVFAALPDGQQVQSQTLFDLDGARQAASDLLEAADMPPPSL